MRGVGAIQLPVFFVRMVEVLRSDKYTPGRSIQVFLHNCRISSPRSKYRPSSAESPQTLCKFCKPSFRCWSMACSHQRLTEHKRVGSIYCPHNNYNNFGSIYCPQKYSVPKNIGVRDVLGARQDSLR
jgi:hypothetical protein